MATFGELNLLYHKLLEQQEFDPDSLDYSIANDHIQNLNILASIGQSGITVFDLYKKEHIFASYNMNKLFGYHLNENNIGDTALFNQKVHPNDMLDLLKGGIQLIRFMLNLLPNERKNFKLVSEYRILNSKNEYTRVVEQQSQLEADRIGNVWLALGVLDISPNQDVHSGVKQTLINIEAKEIVPFIGESQNSTILTHREIEILKMIESGLLSKEISDELSISLHTVNTHRQHILGKLDVNNSMEAVKYARDLGLLG